MGNGANKVMTVSSTDLKSTNIWYEIYLHTILILYIVYKFIQTMLFKIYFLNIL